MSGRGKKRPAPPPAMNEGASVQFSATPNMNDPMASLEASEASSADDLQPDAEESPEEEEEEDLVDLFSRNAGRFGR